MEQSFNRMDEYASKGGKRRKEKRHVTCEITIQTFILPHSLTHPTNTAQKQ
jgi:hypothetical protein